MDWIALASVTTSGAIALATVAANFLTARGQRRHESTLAYEARAWERKSDALFDLIQAGRELLDPLMAQVPSEAELLGPVARDVSIRLDGLLPVIEAYASEECRARLHDVRERLRPAKRLGLESARLYNARLTKERAVDEGDFEKAAAWRDKERGALRAMTAALDIDHAALRRDIERLLAAARVSVRGQA